MDSSESKLSGMLSGNSTGSSAKASPPSGPREIGYAILADLPDEMRVHVLDEDNDYKAVNPEAVGDLAEYMMEVVATVVAGIIDAGSERDAVMENERLRNALWCEFAGWAPEAR